MADYSWSHTYSGARPNINYTIDCTKSRLSNSQMRYDFTITWGFPYSESYLGTGYGLYATAVVNGSSSGAYNYKESSVTYSGTTRHSFSLSVTCSSYSGGESQSGYIDFTSTMSYGVSTFYFTVSSSGLLYTSCTAPTSVSLSRSGGGSAVKPNDSVVVSWSGAGGGTNNPITSYGVYIKISSNGSAPTTADYTYVKEVDSTSGSGSCTFDISDATRTYKIVASVRARGSAGGDYYSPLKTGGNLTVNSLPSAPSVTTPLTIPSTSTKGHLTVSAGAMNGGSSKSSNNIYYSGYSNGTKSLYQSSTQLSAGTWYFWTYDGLEYSSSYSSGVISKNTKPSISSSTLTITKSSTVKNNPLFSRTDTLSVERLSIKASATANRNTGSYYLYLGYRDYDNSKTPTLTPTSQILLGAVSVTAKALSEQTYNVREKNIPNGRTLFFGLKYNDGIEDSDTLWIYQANESSSSTTKKYMAIAPLPQIISTTNQWDDTSLTGANTGDFWYKLRLKLSYDSYFFENGSFSCLYGLSTGSPETFATQNSLTNDGSYIRLDLSTAQNLTPGQNYVFQITVNGDSKSIVTFILRQSPVITSATSSKNVFKPYTEGATVSSSKIFSLPNLTAQTSYTNFLKEYNLSSTIADWWKIYFIYNNNEIEFNPGSSSIPSTLSSDYITRTFVIDSTAGAKFYNSINSYFSEKNGTYNLNYKTKIKNLFGRESEITTSDYPITLNFDESPVVSGSNWISYLNGTSIVALLTTEKICEGLNIVFNPTIKLYNGSSFSYAVEICRNLNTPSAWENYISGALSFTNTSAYNNPTTISWTDLSKLINTTVGEISSSTNCKFRITIQAINGLSASLTSSEIQRVFQTPASLTLQTVNYSGSDYVITYVGTSLGIDTNPTSGIISLLHDTDQINWISSTTLAPLQTFISGSTATIAGYKGGKTFEKVKVKIYTKLTTSFRNDYSITNEKTFISNEVVLFGLSPTVAYRMGHVGINTTSFQTNDLLAVYPSTSSGTSRHIIRLLSPTNEAYLDLDNGTIDGFSIDAGEI